MRISNPFASTIDYLKYTKGDTFVSLEASMIFQDKIINRQIRVLLDHRESQNVSINFFKYWSACFYPFQNMTLYGVIFPKFPHLKSYFGKDKNRQTSI